MKILILVVLALLLISFPLYAQSTIYGYGAYSCGHYVKALDGYRHNNRVDSIDYFVFVGWFQGFATNQSIESGQNVLHGRDVDSIGVWLEKYCREHPVDKFVTAGQKLLSDQGK